jgi:hypothetical protein
MLSNAYWTRIWIVQELILANSIILYYNGLAIHWRNLYPLLSDTSQGTERMNLHHFLEFTDGRCAPDRNAGLVLSGFPNVFWSNAQCHDPRDVYYALQTLLPQDLRITVDYSKPILEVFIDAALLITSYHDIEKPDLARWLTSLAIGMGLQRSGDTWNSLHARLKRNLEDYRLISSDWTSPTVEKEFSRENLRTILS